MLNRLNSVKVLVGRNETNNYRGTGVKRTMITAVECVSADGRHLDPLIIWHASTHRSSWTTHPTPGWHFAHSASGCTDSAVGRYWIQHVFHPLTKNHAGKRPRVLISDGFGTHESFEIIKFCHENNIILCRLPFHTSHKLQPCDVGVFDPLKAAYPIVAASRDRPHSRDSKYFKKVLLKT
jgi:DDE superfamily endonuclease